MNSFQISGREMFEFNPDLIEGDDAEASTEHYKPESDEVCKNLINLFLRLMYVREFLFVLELQKILLSHLQV